MPQATILSGIRPTGQLHVGNYLGALAHFVKLQNDYRCFFFIADLHAVNEPYPPEQLPARVRETAAAFLAAGLDPRRATLFVQSHLPQHAQLAVILANFIPVGYLFRMTQYKEKAGQHARESANAGLLYYPVLMAADILLYHPTYVPVGDDQDQHVELSRDVAGFFNRRFGETFRPPETLHTQAPRVMSLLEPTKKMSKTLGGDHCLNLDDADRVIKRKLARAVTDSGDGSGVGTKNLLHLLEQFGAPAVVQRFRQSARNQSLRYAELKSALADALIASLRPIQARKRQFLDHPERLEKILAAGAKRAALVAAKTLDTVKKKIGLIAVP